MPIDGISLLSGTTDVTYTGGSALVLNNDGLAVNNGIHVVDLSEDNFFERKHATFKNRAPRTQTDGTTSKGKRDFNITVPKTLADGTTVFGVFRGEMELPVEFLEADITELRRLASQCLVDSDLDHYYVVGAIS